MVFEGLVSDAGSEFLVDAQTEVTAHIARWRKSSWRPYLPD
jgi:hypothetical protein